MERSQNYSKIIIHLIWKNNFIMKKVRIAMWSGPRNISTALMRSFENRKDTSVLDEPFYAFYLDKKGYNHPIKEVILKSQNKNWLKLFRIKVLI